MTQAHPSMSPARNRASKIAITVLSLLLVALLAFFFLTTDKLAVGASVVSAGTITVGDALAL